MIEINSKQLCEFCFNKVNDGNECGCGFSANPSDCLQVGAILNGRYLVGRCIRENRITKEYLCFDSQTDSTVIVKEFFPKVFVTRVGTENVTLLRDSHLNSYNTSMQKFIELMQIPQRLTNSDCFINVIGAFYENSTAYFVMENHSLMSVEDYVKAYGRMSDKVVAASLDAAIKGLSAMSEASVYNGNIKAGNTFITNDRIVFDGFEPNEDDFASLTGETMMFNRTSYYMSASDFGKRGRDISSDIFSTGAVMYTMLTARFPSSPFECEAQFDISALESSTSDRELLRIIKKMCRINCEGYKSVSELSADASGLFKKHGLSGASVSHPSAKKISDNRLKIIIAVCALIVIIATVAVLAITKGHSNDSQSEIAESITIYTEEKL